MDPVAQRMAALLLVVNGLSALPAPPAPPTPGSATGAGLAARGCFDPDSATADDWRAAAQGLVAVHAVVGVGEQHPVATILEPKHPLGEEQDVIRFDLHRAKP